MKLSKYTWLFGLVITIGLIVVPMIIFLPRADKTMSADPWEMYLSAFPIRIIRTSSRDRSKPVLMSPGLAWNVMMMLPERS